MRLDADLLFQRGPTLRASSIAGGISAMPPDEKLVRIGWPEWLLRSVVGLKLIEDLGNR